MKIWKEQLPQKSIDETSPREFDCNKSLKRFQQEGSQIFGKYQAGNKFLCTQMTQMIKIDANFFIFYLSQRHEGHKGVVFSEAFFVSFVPL